LGRIELMRMLIILGLILSISLEVVLFRSIWPRRRFVSIGRTILWVRIRCWRKLKGGRRRTNDIILFIFIIDLVTLNITRIKN
jgi:hypothetical protein